MVPLILGHQKMFFITICNHIPNKKFHFDFSNTIYGRVPKTIWFNIPRLMSPFKNVYGF
jgi:hypothetical protein